MGRRETIRRAETKIQARIRAAILEIAPYSALFIGLRKFAGLPSGEPGRARDFADQQPIAKVGCQQTDAVEFVCKRRGVIQGKQTAERDARQPQLNAAGRARTAAAKPAVKKSCA